MKISSKLSCWLIYFIISFLLIFPGCSSSPTPETNDPIIQSFYAEPSSISSGENSTLHWQVSDATSVSIDQGIGAVATISGSTAVSPTVTTAYTLTATNTSGSVTASTTVVVDEGEVGYGIIEINSTPSGASIYLDGVDTGKQTPNTLTSIESGNHTIKLTSWLYYNWENIITLNPGQILEIDAILELATTEEMIIKLSDSTGIDAGVETANSGTNYGNLDFFAAGNSAAPNTARAYLKFNLEGIPSEAVVTDVIFYLYNYGCWGSGNASIGIYRVLENWEEDTINWSNQPNFTAWCEDAISFSSSGGGIFIAPFDATYLCIDWINGTIPNYGFLLKAEDESTGTYAALFYSSESANEDNRPKLIIYYYIP
jgi:hypothetical protein